MADNNTSLAEPTGPLPGDPAWDPRFQTLIVLAMDGTPMDIPLEQVNFIIKIMVQTSIGYAAQIGACFIMLVVMLTMTAKTRFGRVPTIVNTLGLLVSIVRFTLLVVYFSSSYADFYTIMSGDISYVNPVATHCSVAGTLFSVPQLLLAEAALMVQAWAMVELWDRVCKYAGIAMSVVIALVCAGFKVTSTVIQVNAIVNGLDVMPWKYLREADLISTTVMICWFCVMFNVRLVMHMWKNRSILPSIHGLSPMEVLVVANGLLMFVPVFFTLIYYGNIAEFESAPLGITTVVLVLPLGTLVARRIAASGTKVGPSIGVKGMYSSGTTDSGKRPFLAAMSTAGSSRFNSLATPKLSTSVSAGHVPTTVGSGRLQQRADQVDLELQAIDDDNDEGNYRGPGVRVERSIERREERIR